MSEFRPGDSNQITRRYMDSLLIEMRNLGGQVADTRFELFGRQFATPVTTAALSHLKSPRGNGMVELAKAAKQAEAVMFYGMGSLTELDEVARTGAAVIKIIKPYADDQEIISRIRRATELGCLAIGMDIDHSFKRDGQLDVVLGEEMQPVDEDKLRRFMAQSPLPFVVKGVLSVHDALICKRLGVQGIVVSHHHGIMDYAPPPLMMLPRIREAVGPDMKIFVDCGIMSGADAFKALALGADAVSLGRMIMPPLEEKGPEGGAEEIRRITRELSYFMARTATHDLHSFDPACVIRPGIG